MERKIAYSTVLDNKGSLSVYRMGGTAEGAISGGRVLKLTIFAALFVCIAHLFLRSNPIVVTLAFFIFILGVIPMVIEGYLNIAALLIFLVAFRYLDFAAFAKLALGQALDSNLYAAIAAFAAVLLGLVGYLTAFSLAKRMRVGRPLLAPVVQEKRLLMISFFSALVGVIAWAGKIKSIDMQALGVDLSKETTYYAFFTNFYLLSIIAATAQALIASKGRRSISKWNIVLLIGQLLYAFISNARMPIVNGIAAYLLTVIAYQGKVRWRNIAILGFSFVILITFITPVMLWVRGIRSELSAKGRISSTIDAAITAISQPTVLNEYRNRITSSYGFLNYYGERKNVLERASLVEHVDVMIDGIRTTGYEMLKTIKIGFGRILPRFLNPNKDIGWSIGDVLYYEIGYSTTIGGFSTVPLIAEGYASFGWIGVFFFPLLFAAPVLLALKKIGWSLHRNIWSIYMLLRFHNIFVEQASGGYLLTLFRFLPQDLIVIFLINLAAGSMMKRKMRIRSVYGNLDSQKNR